MEGKIDLRRVGEGSDVDVDVASGEGGAHVVAQEDRFGQPLAFVPCGK